MSVILIDNIDDVGDINNIGCVGNGSDVGEFLGDGRNVANLGDVGNYVRNGARRKRW